MVERVDLKTLEYVTLGDDKEEISKMKQRAFDSDHDSVVTCKLNDIGKKKFLSVDEKYNRVISDIAPHFDIE